MSQNENDQLKQILRSGINSDSIAGTSDRFVSEVMHRVHQLDASFALPVWMWMAPALLAVTLTFAVVLGVQTKAKPELVGIEDLLLADIPTETQGLLSKSPSFSNLLWTPSAGGFLP